MKGVNHQLFFVVALAVDVQHVVLATLHALVLACETTVVTPTRTSSTIPTGLAMKGNEVLLTALWRIAERINTGLVSIRTFLFRITVAAPTRKVDTDAPLRRKPNVQRDTAKAQVP